jgi:trk system potassium uptake protein TrkH
MLDFRPVAFVVGFMLAALSALMLLPALVGLAEGGSDWRVFVRSAGLTAFVGGGMILATRGGRIRLNQRQAFLLTVVAWIAIAAFAALPFLLAPLGLDAADAFFEAMSGLTTTGATVIVGLDRCDPALLLWRSMLQFIGGIGIIVIAVAVLPLLRVGGMQLFRLESSDKSEKVLPRAAQIATGIGSIYAGLTLLCALVFWALGMPGFDAVNHAMAAVSTGGFSTRDASFGAFSSAALDMACVVFMLCGGMTLTLFLRAYGGDRTALWRDTQVRTYLGLFAAFSLAITAWLVLKEGWSPGDALRHAGFTVASVLTTTGFVSTDWGLWGPFPLALVFLLTFVGGCSGSTSGGIKIFRFQVLFQIGRAQTRHALMPSGVCVLGADRRGAEPVRARSGDRAFRRGHGARQCRPRARRRHRPVGHIRAAAGQREVDRVDGDASRAARNDHRDGALHPQLLADVSPAGATTRRARNARGPGAPSPRPGRPWSA